MCFKSGEDTTAFRLRHRFAARRARCMPPASNMYLHSNDLDSLNPTILEVYGRLVDWNLESWMCTDLLQYLRTVLRILQMEMTHKWASFWRFLSLAYKRSSTGRSLDLQAILWDSNTNLLQQQFITSGHCVMER